MFKKGLGRGGGGGGRGGGGMDLLACVFLCGLEESLSVSLHLCIDMSSVSLTHGHS